MARLTPPILRAILCKDTFKLSSFDMIYLTTAAYNSLCLQISFSGTKQSSILSTLSLIFLFSLILFVIFNTSSSCLLFTLSQSSLLGLRIFFLQVQILTCLYEYILEFFQFFHLHQKQILLLQNLLWLVYIFLLENDQL